MKKQIFNGVCTALVTPFLDDKINFPLIKQMLRAQASAGVKAVVLAGTTGESATLSDMEKIELFKYAKNCVADDMLIIAGTGSNCTAHAVELSQEAETTGADALLVVSPYYNKSNPDGLFKHYMSIAHSVNIPIIIYNVPSRTGVDIPVSVYQRLSVLPNIAGVKEAGADITKITKIRAFCKEDDEVKSFKEENDALLYDQKRVSGISALMNPLTYVVINFSIIAIIWFGGVRVNSGSLTQGQVIALYNYMSQILVELIKLANMIITINKSLASASRIENVLSTEKTVETPNLDEHSDSFIEFKNVSFKYSKSNEYSLSNIDFKVNKGETVGIIGSTGSGKSTLVNLIPRFYGSTEGTVLLDGKDVKAYTDEELRSRIGLVPQKNVLFKGTIRENLLLGGKTVSDDELNAALNTAQALEIVEIKGGLDAKVEQGGKNLSGGQKQRICIARALVGNPEILIFDDSSSALDYVTEAKLRKALGSLDYSPTVFIVSQRVSSVMFADKIIVMEDGSAVAIGKHDELKENCSVYAEICRTQLKED